MVTYFNDPRPRYQLSIPMEIYEIYSVRNICERQRYFSTTQNIAEPVVLDQVTVNGKEIELVDGA